MTSAARLLLVSGIILTGCGTAKKAAVSTFRVLDAPARYVRERIDPAPATTTTTTTTTETSDVVTPGRPVTSTPPPVQRNVTQNRTAGASGRSSSSPSARSTATAGPRTGASSAPPTQFPTARPVPGRPGYVYSVDPKGGIVDVTGYKSGDKAKDPYTQQIFIVP